MNSAKFGNITKDTRKSEKIDKRPALKKYAEINLYKKLEEIFYENNLLTPKGITTPTLQRTVRRVLNCSTKSAYTDKTLIDRQTGEIQSRKYALINNNCGVNILCPVCSEKRTRRIQAHYLPLIKELSKGKHMYSVTFTIENTPEFLPGYYNIKNGLRKFRVKGQKGRSGEASKIDAGIYNIEVLPGIRPGTYHIHAHSLMITNKPLDYSIYEQEEKKKIIAWYQKEFNCKPDKDALLPAVKKFITINGIETPVSKLSSEWYEATKGSGINIHVQPISGDPEAIDKSIREILKYNSKINNMETNQIYEILRDKKGLRLLDTWGKLRRKDNLEDDIIKEDHEEIEINLSAAEIDVYNNIENSYDSVNNTGLNKFVDHLIDNYDGLKKYRSDINSARAEKDKMIRGVMSMYEIFKSKEDELALRKESIKKINRINYLYHTFAKWYFKFKLKLESRGLEKVLVFYLHENDRTIMKTFMKRINLKNKKKKEELSIIKLLTC